MSAEPETRHFTTEELAQFLDQLAFERPLARAERLAKRVDLKPGPIPLLQADPATMLGTGHLVPIGAPQLRLHARARGDVALRAAVGDCDADALERGARAAGRRLPWRWLAGLPSLLFVGWLACVWCLPAEPSVAHGTRSGPPALPVAPHPTRPPTPGPATVERSSMSAGASPRTVPTPTSTSTSDGRPAGGSPRTAQSPTPTARTMPAVAPAPTVQSLVPTARTMPAVAPAPDLTPTPGLRRTSPDATPTLAPPPTGPDLTSFRGPQPTAGGGTAQRGAPLALADPVHSAARGASTTANRQGALALRPESRRQAVDLLLSGRTRAALDAYRALQLATPDEPALAQVVRLLARELETCREQMGLPCGS